MDFFFKYLKKSFFHTSWSFQMSVLERFEKISFGEKSAFGTYITNMSPYKHLTMYSNLFKSFIVTFNVVSISWVQRNLGSHTSPSSCERLFGLGWVGGVGCAWLTIQKYRIQETLYLFTGTDSRKQA